MFKHLITSESGHLFFMLCSLLFHKFSFKHRDKDQHLQVSLFLVALLLQAAPGEASVAAEEGAGSPTR